LRELLVKDRKNQLSTLKKYIQVHCNIYEDSLPKEISLNQYHHAIQMIVGK